MAILKMPLSYSLCISVQHLSAFMISASILQTLLCMFRVPPETKNSNSCRLLNVQQCWGGFWWKAKSLFGWGFLFVWGWCWVVWFVGFFNIYALFMLSGDVGGPWGLDRTSVDSSESTLHRTEFSLFELYSIFSLTKKKIKKISNS